MAGNQVKDNQYSLQTLRVSNGALKADKLPDRIKLLNWGQNDSTKGPVILDESSVHRFSENQRHLGHERVALDFEHNTVPGSPEFERSSEPRKVAAYGTPRIVDGDGLYLEGITWTPEGMEAARNYEDLSPAVGLTKDRKVIFVHSAALTRNGAVFDLTFYSADQLFNLLSKKPMDETITVAELAAALSLPETATKADVLERLQALGKEPEVKPEDVEAMSATIETLTTRLEALEKVDPKPAQGKKPEDVKPAEITELSATVDGETVTVKVADLVALTSRVEKIETDRKAESDAQANSERATLIARFSAEGKVPRDAEGKEFSAEALEKLSVDALKLLLSNTPATVPLNARAQQAKSGKNSNLKGRARIVEAFAS